MEHQELTEEALPQLPGIRLPEGADTRVAEDRIAG
jgi:hypothetical protein